MPRVALQEREIARNRLERKDLRFTKEGGQVEGGDADVRPDVEDRAHRPDAGADCRVDRIFPLRAPLEQDLVDELGVARSGPVPDGLAVPGIARLDSREVLAAVVAEEANRARPQQ